MDVDWDEVFSYRTAKVVRVRDRRVGLLRIFLLLPIVAYIVGFVVIWNKGYLKHEEPQGTLELGLVTPDKMIMLDSHDYCSQSSGSTSMEVANRTTDTGIIIQRPCKMLDAADLVASPDSLNSIMVATRITQSEQTPGCAAFESCQTPFETTSEVDAYVGGFEDYLVRLRHSMQAIEFYQSEPLRSVNSRYAGNSDNMKGSLMNRDGSVLKTFPSGSVDNVTLDELLTAAGGTSLDTVDDDGSCARAKGIVLFILVKYETDDNWLPTYSYEVIRVPDSVYSTTQSLPHGFASGGGRTLLTRHGVKLVFVQSGRISKFDFQVLLIALVSAVGLTGVAQMCVEYFMLWCLPRRDNIKSHKYEVTDDFSDLDAQVKLMKNDPALADLKVKRLEVLAKIVLEARRRKELTEDEILTGAEKKVLRRLVYHQDGQGYIHEGGFSPAEQERMHEMQLTTDDQVNYRRAFDLLDTDGSGSVGPDEIKRLYAICNEDEPTEEEVRIMFDEADHDGSNAVEFVEFLALVQARKNEETLLEAAGKPSSRVFSGPGASADLVSKLVREVIHAQFLDLQKGEMQGEDPDKIERVAELVVEARMHKKLASVLTRQDKRALVARVCGEEDDHANFLVGEMATFRRAFDMVDTNQSGGISLRELRHMFDCLYLDVEATPYTDLRELFKEVDRDCNGVIDFDEFMLLLRNKRTEETVMAQAGLSTPSIFSSVELASAIIDALSRAGPPRRDTHSSAPSSARQTPSSINRRTNQNSGSTQSARAPYAASARQEPRYQQPSQPHRTPNRQQAGKGRAFQGEEQELAGMPSSDRFNFR